MERRLRVPGGKTLILDITCQNDEVEAIRISGDFFFHPEEGLEGLETFLVERKVWRSEDPEGDISDYLSRNGCRTAGFGPSDLAFLLRGLRC